ncbi:MAG: CHAD domain-containing protein [Actinomycetes bacterium]
MTMPPRVLQAADGGALDLAVVVDALAGEFAVSTGARRVVRRTQLDTFDHRLRAAGLALEHQGATSGERLVLSGTAVASPVVVQGTGLRWPAHAAALPAGPVRDAVAPVTGIRALMVISDEKRRVRWLELRNQDQKIVARVEVDEPGGGSSPRAELAVHTLRGYEDQARRAVRLLRGLGLRPGGPGEDVEPAVVSPTAGLDRDSPAALLLARQLGGFLATMRANLPGLLDDVDTEFLHDFRVAVRRTRSTLKLGRPALPEVMHTSWEPAFKRLGDLTTPLRDLDVYELDLPAMGGWLVAADAADLAPFAEHLRRRRTAQRRALARRLRSAWFDRMIAQWEVMLAQTAEGQPEGAQDGLSAGALADLSISRAYRRVARGGAAISGDSPAEDLHTLRKRCKELRYALEVFDPVIDAADRKGAIADLKDLQDVLGRFQDSEVQRLALRDFAQEMMYDGTPAAAVLAMGELIGHLDAEQDRARRDFDGEFARFARPSSARRMHRLGGGR